MPDWATNDDVIGPGCEGCGGCGDAFLIVCGAAGWADAGGDDQAALGFGQGADQGGLLRGGDDAIGTCQKRPAGTFNHQIGQCACLNKAGIKICAVKRC